MPLRGAKWTKVGRVCNRVGETRVRILQEWKSACKPGSVVRERTGNHSSGRRVTTPLEQPTRKRREPRHGFPIWPCPGWGFACRVRCRTRGGLLPGVAARPKAHHFNLACALRPSAVCFLFHFPSPWAALSRGLLRPAVSRHPALRGPDFPPRLRAAVARRTSGTDSTALQPAVPGYQAFAGSAAVLCNVTKVSASTAALNRQR